MINKQTELKVEETNPAPKKKRKIRITEIFGFIIIFAIIAMLVFVLYSNFSGKMIFVFGKATAWVMTESMEPIIPERSFILISKVSAEDVQVGYIIIFKSDDPVIKDKYNTHRVIEIKGNEFVTKGDNNLSADSFTAKAEKIVGRYEKNLEVLTAIGRFMYSGIGFLITITFIFVIVMVLYIPDLMKAIKDNEGKAEEKKKAQIDELVKQEVERLKRENENKNNLNS